MSNQLRCPICFAPKKHPEEVCKFCGLNPKTGKRPCDEPLPDGLSLDEKINRLLMRER